MRKKSMIYDKISDVQRMLCLCLRKNNVTKCVLKRHSFVLTKPKTT